MRFKDRQFADLVDHLCPGGLLVFNGTRVAKARFFNQKVNGDRVEVLAERLLGGHTVLMQTCSNKSPVEGTILCLADAFDMTMDSCTEPFFMLHFPQSVLDLIEQCGRLPLSPYIEHDPDNSDETRYQTAYMCNPGAVAASTTGLHFDDVLFTKLNAMGVQHGFLMLHVSAGIFQPVHVESIVKYRMYNGWYETTPELAETIRVTRAADGRIIAVDTTPMRALELVAQPNGILNACNNETDIFITFGYRFRAVDLLMANSHLSKSTSLMLVSAFVGISATREARQYAAAQYCRFFNYGDTMLLTCAPTEPSEPGETQSL